MKITKILDVFSYFKNIINHRWRLTIKKILNFFCKVLQVYLSYSFLTSHFEYTSQKMKFSIRDFSSKCDQIRSFLRIWSHLLKIFVMENCIFCAVVYLGIIAHDYHQLTFVMHFRKYDSESFSRNVSKTSILEDSSWMVNLQLNWSVETFDLK